MATPSEASTLACPERVLTQREYASGSASPSVRRARFKVGLAGLVLY